MDYTELVNLIGSLGFPIVCCIVLFRQNNKLTDTLHAIQLNLQSLATGFSQLNNKIDERKEN